MLRKRFEYDLGVEDFTSIMGNRLFCTFTQESALPEVLHKIGETYTVLFGKIFILEAKEQGEFLVTYNVELGNVSMLLENTILVHRKKESKTLYTINALNTLIRSLNRGELDTNYKIDWSQYRNCILLTKGPELRKVETVLHKVLDIT